MTPKAGRSNAAPFGEEHFAIVRDRLAAIIRSADDAIFSKDAECVVTSWNPAAERLYGFTAEEIVGRPISIIVPSDRAGEELTILSRIMNGEEVRHYETQRVTRDGRIIDVSVTASPIHDADGHIVGASVIARDIAQVRSSLLLANRLAAIVQSSDDAIYSKDAKAIVDSWNPGAERLYGYTAEEAIGRHIRFLVPLDRKGEETDILNRILRGERLDHFETERLTKSGEVVPVSITVSPIYGPEGRVTGASVIGRDVRERRRLAELQRHIDRTEFIARAAHELRTPITTLAGFADVLSDADALPPDQLTKIGEGIARQSGLLQVLINDLLDLTYIESGRYRMQVDAVSLDEALGDALQTAPAPEGKSVRTSLAPHSVVVGDRARLAQIFVNLLNNAYKYGGNDIEIEARPYSDRVVIHVRDDGPGVPEAIHETVFEPFTRGHGDVRGSGLGLSITSRLVEAQGGTIRLDPTSNGCCFVIDLRRSPSGVTA